MKRNHFLICVVVAFSSVICFVAVRAGLQNQSLREIENARLQLHKENWAEAKRIAEGCVNWFTRTRDREAAAVIEAMADFHLFHLGVLDVHGFLDAQAVLQRVPSTSPSFSDAQFGLAYDSFYRHQRISAAEDMVANGLTIEKDHAALLQLRLDLMMASSRWVEACEVLPVEANTRDRNHAIQLVNNWTKATFFPELYLTELDRRLGIIADDENRNGNSDLDRLTHLLDNETDCTSCYAGLAQWYQRRQLPEVAIGQLESGKDSFSRRPVAVFLQRYLSLTHGTDAEQRSAIEVFASPGRLSAARLELNWNPKPTDWDRWPLKADTELTQLRVENFNDETAMEIQRLQRKWMIDRREELLEAVGENQFEAGRKVLAECWSDFGQEDMAQWIMTIE